MVLEQRRGLQEAAPALSAVDDHRVKAHAQAPWNSHIVVEIDGAVGITLGIEWADRPLVEDDRGDPRRRGCLDCFPDRLQVFRPNDVGVLSSQGRLEVLPKNPRSYSSVTQDTATPRDESD